ncbi:MAG: hypothetical protein ISS79_10265 [Phycisphaerae bacterium]|nr:hypothetical protein [Phycisphaerae bacterium]
MADEETWGKAKPSIEEFFELHGGAYLMEKRRFDIIRQIVHPFKEGRT